jgi:hypothetical protein
MKTFRIAELSEVFSTGDMKTPHALMARLAVLYEDMRIEVLATAEPSIPLLDITDVRHRQNYFLRRSIATLVEFAEAIRLLDECPEFHSIKMSFPPELRDRWNEGVRFFRDHEQFFKDVRNDVGGHFGSEAARFAIEHIHTEGTGEIEGRDDKTVHLHFVMPLVATAMTRHLQGMTAEEKFTPLFKDAVAGFKYATDCTHCVVFGYLWQRFGR